MKIVAFDRVYNFIFFSFGILKMQKNITTLQKLYFSYIMPDKDILYIKLHLSMRYTNNEF
jgi:hypothetical protein